MQPLTDSWQLDVALAEVPPTHAEESFKSYYILNAGGTAGNDLALRLHPNGLCVITLAPTHAALSGRGGGGQAEAEAAAANQEPVAGSQQPSICITEAPAASNSKPQQLAPEAAAGTGEAEASEAAADRGLGQGAAAAASQPGAGARLTLAPKLLQAEFRKGRGPLLQPDTNLGRLHVAGIEYVLRCGVRGLLVEVRDSLQQLQGPELLRAIQGQYLAILEPRAAEVTQLAGRCLSEEQYQQQQQQQRQQQRQQQQ